MVFGLDFTTLLQRLSQLFALLNITKSRFTLREVTIWGHTLSGKGCRSGPANIEPIQNLKLPTNIKEMRRFLGMCGFYCKHIHQFAKIAHPLTNQTKNNVVFIGQSSARRLC